VKRFLTHPLNFIDIFVHTQWYGGLENKQPVPRKFAWWTAASLLSGIIGNKAWIEREGGEVTFPNLYVIMIAPSGIGKGTLIKPLFNYVKPIQDLCRVYATKCTSASCIDTLTESIPFNDGGHIIRVPKDPKLYIIQEELSYCIGDGNEAKRFIKFMTAHYSPTKFFREETRTAGVHEFTEPITLNWIGATPSAWLRDVIRPADLTEGFGARIVWLVTDYNDEFKGGLNKVYPPDFEACDEFLRTLAIGYANWPTGPLRISPEAHAMIDNWLVSRAIPQDVPMRPFHQREGDLVLKLSMVECIASLEYTITPAHVQVAIYWVEALRREDIPQIIRLSSIDDLDDDLYKIERLIARMRVVSRSDLLRLYRIRSFRLDIILRELMQSKTIYRLPPEAMQALELNRNNIWYGFGPPEDHY
jgi:hypothetical protein